MIRPREPELDAGGPLFASPGVRRTDPKTSASGAAAVEPILRTLQLAVLRAFERTTMHAIECETLPQFEHYGASTIRKRISELAQGGFLEPAGVERVGRSTLTVYRLTQAGADALAGE